MSNMSLQLPSQRRDAQGHILTHGYVHGHVHQHKDHVHIHGHIHNHDHVEQQQLHAVESDGKAQIGQHTHAELECKELEPNFDLCNDIFCDELDDCYLYDCDRPDTADNCATGRCEEFDDEGECCDNEACFTDPQDDICTDSCAKTEHENSLCDLQKPRLTIFENLIQNVHKNVEQYTAPENVSGLAGENVHGEIPAEFGGNSPVPIDPQFHIHFPHHCHQVPLQRDNPVLPNAHTQLPEHTTHQQCFHAKLPTKTTFGEMKQEPQSEQDYDFFVQFNNFKQIFDDQNAKVSEIKEPPSMQPHTFSCQWENCLQSVDNESLMDHLLGQHLNCDNQSHQGNPVKLECEWDDCGFVDENVKSFLDHLNTHKNEEYRKEASPLLTPSSIEAVCETPHKLHANDPQPLLHSHGLNISEIRISPKTAPVPEPADPSHTCKWEIGTDNAGNAIVCGLKHASDGELQEHLKTAHIGRGKSIYHCCWHGCERNHGKPFAQRQKLFRHIHIHTGHKPCVCDVCDARFAVPSMLKQHQRIHSGEKPYKCAECGRCFATSSSLAIHTRVHTDSRPLECTWPGCGKRFRESSNLAKHLRTHTTYVCEHCGKSFDTRRSFTRHKKTHQVVLPEQEPIQA
ncbi:hypothetical protein OXX80_005293 [Metschnikowia pulcherrima]